MTPASISATCLIIALHAASCAHPNNYSIASFNCTNQTFVAEVRSQTYNSEVPFILIPGQLKGEDAISVASPSAITLTWQADGQEQASATYRLDGIAKDAFDPRSKDTLLFLFCPGVQRPYLLSETRRPQRRVVLHDLETHAAVVGRSIDSACELCRSGERR